MITRTPDPAVPYFDVADPAFCVTSAEVRRAREAGWYARTSYGLAVLRYDQVSRLIRHPALRQGSRLWPAHHGITSSSFSLRVRTNAAPPSARNPRRLIFGFIWMRVVSWTPFPGGSLKSTHTPG